MYKNDTLRKATDYIGSLILENDTLQFIQTAEGRVVPKTVDGVDKNEYQYHLKDHLGNVRSTFAVRDDDYATGFETATNPYFDNYDEITILSNPLKKSGTYAHRLTGGGTNIVGLMKSLYVSKGDRIRAEVYAKYLDAQFTNDGINGAALINALVSMLGGGTLTGEGTVIENNLNTDFISAAMADGSQETSPKAYLNYILLDKNFNYLNSGFERLGSSAADPGDGSGTHQKLSFEEILVQEDGYLMVFLSNESDQSVEVFWDDFRVDHHYNAVLQADDYYPFGLTFNSYQRSYSKANNYKYNGKEEQEETGWYDYGARMYQADLGRFFNQDRYAEKYMDHNPYHYTLNNPIKYIDINGDSTYRFDADGKYLGLFDTEVEGVRGVIGSYSTVTDSEGNEEQVFNTDMNFTFNDPNLDKWQLYDMEIGQQGIQIVSDEEINGIMNNAGIKEMNFVSRLYYAGTQSGSDKDFSDGNKMDFGVQYLGGMPYTEVGGFFIMGDQQKAYNAQDAGNWLWGNSMKRLGFDYSTAEFSSQVNEGFNDSEADQRAIRIGYHYNVKTKKSSVIQLKND